MSFYMDAQGKPSHKSGISYKDSIRTDFSETHVMRESRGTIDSKSRVSDAFGDPVARMSRLDFSPSERHSEIEDPFVLQPRIAKK